MLPAPWYAMRAQSAAFRAYRVNACSHVLPPRHSVPLLLSPHLCWVGACKQQQACGHKGPYHVLWLEGTCARHGMYEGMHASQSPIQQVGVGSARQPPYGYAAALARHVLGPVLRLPQAARHALLLLTGCATRAAVKKPAGVSCCCGCIIDSPGGIGRAALRSKRHLGVSVSCCVALAVSWVLLCFCHGPRPFLPWA